MNVLHVIDQLVVGGAERMLVEIVNQMEPPYFPLVCVTRSGTTMADQLHSRIPLFVLDRKSRFDLKKILRFLMIIRSEKVDLIHAHGRSSFSFAAFAKNITF